MVDMKNKQPARMNFIGVGGFSLLALVALVGACSGGSSETARAPAEPEVVEVEVTVEPTAVEVTVEPTAATIRCTSTGVSADILTQGTATSCEEALALYRHLVPATIAEPGSPAVDLTIILACAVFQGDSVSTYETPESGLMYDALNGTACDGDRSNLIPA